jgi:hypothetical protein
MYCYFRTGVKTKREIKSSFAPTTILPHAVSIRGYHPSPALKYAAAKLSGKNPGI